MKGLGAPFLRTARFVAGDAFARSDHLGEPMALMAGLFALSLLAATLGAAAPALVLLWGPVAVHYLFFAKVHESARVYLLLALFLEPPELVPGCGYWTSPLDGANRVFYDSIKNVTGLPGASVPLAFVVAAVLLLRARRAPRGAVPLFAWRSLMGYGAALAAIAALGLLRGGAPEPAFRQGLHMATGVSAGLMFLLALRGPEDLFRLGTLIVAVASVRALLVAFVYLVICAPQGITPAFCTTHADSVTFDLALLILLAHALEARTRRSLVRLVTLGALLVAAMVMNNRRLAFVGAGAGALAMVAALPPSPARTRVVRSLVPVGVLLAAYIAVGQASSSPLFAPARLALSALSQEDTSADSRVVENDNLIVTFRENPLFGSGLGFEYIEVQKLYDISEIFAYYRYIPHNSVLWLLTLGGVFGFFFLWAPYVVHVFMAARAHAGLASPTERAGALACVAAAVVAIVNDWGDQGRSNYINVVAAAATFALAAKLYAVSGPRTPGTGAAAGGSPP